MAHSAPIFDDAQGYRVEDVLEQRKNQDCLKKLRESIIEEGVSEELLLQLIEDTRKFVNTEIEYALAAEFPKPQELYTDLYA